MIVARIISDSTLQQEGQKTISRKRHSHEAGYIAERMNPHDGKTKVVIYEAAEQGIDVGGLRYAVVCKAHGTTCGATSVPKARPLMKSVEFCGRCMDSATGIDDSVSGLGSVADEHNHGTWSCVDPCAILGRAVLRGQIELTVDIRNTLDNFGWLDADGSVDASNVDAEFARAGTAVGCHVEAPA